VEEGSVTRPLNFTEARKKTIQSLARDFDIYDANKDGEIIPAETNFHAQEFLRFDLDGDGRLSKGELVVIERLIERGELWVRQVDRAKDGFPIASENFDGSSLRFAFLDTDQDRLLSETEYFDFQVRRRNERRRFDVNRDGTVSPEEFGQANVRFESIDENGDRRLDEREIGNAIIKGVW
jgi:Ca2+-binding EF-hand superfamily protein